MGQPLKKVVEHYIGLARNSENPHAVLRHAANDFAKAAMDPQNKLASIQLKNMAMEFARAAHRPPTTDDFLDLMRETQMAIEEVGDTADAMDIMARRREVHDDRSDRDAPRVSISPESFNADVTLGRSGSFKYNPTPEEVNNGVKQSDTLAFWQGTKKEAQAITVDVALLNVTPIQPGSFIFIPRGYIRPYGVVEYGSDGNKTSVKFDIGLGTRFTVVGNYVSVLGGMDPPPDIVTAITTETMLGASLGTFAAPSQAPVTSTIYIDDLPSMDSVVRFVPYRAVKLLGLESSLAIGETVSLEFFGFFGLTFPSIRIFYQQSNSAWLTPRTLGGDVYLMRLTNNGASGASFRLPFQLSL